MIKCWTEYIKKSNVYQLHVITIPYVFACCFLFNFSCARLRHSFFLSHFPFCFGYVTNSQHMSVWLGSALVDAEWGTCEIWFKFILLLSKQTTLFDSLISIFFCFFFRRLIIGSPSFMTDIISNVFLHARACHCDSNQDFERNRQAITVIVTNWRIKKFQATWGRSAREVNLI